MDWTIVLLPLGVLAMFMLLAYTNKKRPGTSHSSLFTDSAETVENQACKPGTSNMKEQVAPGQKCVYCKRVANENIPLEVVIGSGELHYCSEICRDETKNYIDSVNKHKGLFLGLTLGTTLAMVLLNGIIIAFNLRTQLMAFTTSTAVIVIGIVIIIFPFSTPQTVQWLGIKKAKATARFLGLVLIVLGFIIPL